MDLSDDEEDDDTDGVIMHFDIQTQNASNDRAAKVHATIQARSRRCTERQGMVKGGRRATGQTEVQGMGRTSCRMTASVELESQPRSPEAVKRKRAVASRTI